MNKFRTVTNCSACGKEHRNLEFRQVKREAGGEWSALCPVTGVRIFADKETTEPLPEPVHKPAKKHNPVVHEAPALPEAEPDTNLNQFPE